ncbi:hypothetical protein BTHE68_31010 [Burkholderia sp. THE68]|nr:hypothetical protein BTHE68_31010 [Burkholderia sp. THE68]
MQVRTLRGERAGEREDFEVAAQFGCVVATRVAQPGDAQAADALKHESRRQSTREKRVVERGAQVIAG